MAVRRPRPRLDLTTAEVFNVAWEMTEALHRKMRVVATCRASLTQADHHLAWLYTPDYLARSEEEVAAARLVVLKILKYGQDIGYFRKPAADTLADWLAKADERDAKDLKFREELSL
jgi:hypothetical protein